MTELPILRNSERSSFKTCQKQWDWGWNFQPDGGGLELAMPRQDARWFGSAWHVVWANYYPPGRKRGIDPHETWEAQMKLAYKTMIQVGDYWGEVEERDYIDAKALGHAMIDGQLKEWSGDPAWEVLAPEHRFNARIPYNPRQLEYIRYRGQDIGVDYLPGGKHITLLVGSMDVTIRDHTDGHIKVVDWKSAAQYDNVSAWLTKDDQVGTYLSTATAFLRKEGLIKSNEEVTGGIWSYARKQMPVDQDKMDDQGRKRNIPQKRHYIANLTGLTPEQVETSLKDGTATDVVKSYAKLTLPKLQAAVGNVKVWGDISKQQPPPLFWRVEVYRNRHNRLRQLERVADDAEQIAMARAGLIGVTKNPGKHCNWCDFKDLCDVDENGGDTEQYIKDVYRVVDRYADHRAGARNSKVTA